MIEYTGTISYVRYYSEETKFIVASFDCDQEGVKINITGNMSYVNKDERYRITGDYVTHPRYGKQFQIQSYEVILADDHDQVIRYLSSPLFKGIGTKQAQAIVDTLGDDALTQIKDNPHCLLRVRGMSEKKMKVITDVLTDQALDHEILNFFMGHGISTRYLTAIQGCYGDETVKVIENNPYQLIEDIEGIGFKTADDIAMKLNFDPQSEYRILAAIEDALMSQCFKSGATYQRYSDIYYTFSRFLPDVPSEVFEQALKSLLDKKRIVLEEDRYYPASLYDSEVTIASLFKKFKRLPKSHYDQEELEDKLSEIEEMLGIHYDETQKEAIFTFMREPAMILTGGPGTGKTTIVLAILKLYRSLHPDDHIDLAAPTGRAAKRLAELTNLEASTIHRLLKWDMHKNVFAMDENNPLSTQLLVIDEFSMVDSLLFSKLLKAGKHVTKILMIGDDQQLPSVSCGNVLKDMMTSGIVPVVALNTIYRQSEGSGIVELAHAIRNNQYHPDLLQAQDVHFMPAANYEVPGKILEIIQEAIDDGFEMDEIQVLAPMYRGVAGIDALNEAIQNLVNPADPFKEEYKAGRRTFRVGDKILQLKNRVEDEVFNGDIGILTEIIPKNPQEGTSEILVVTYDDKEIEYSTQDLFQITHAYCMSVHKSQGNEFPIVIMSVLRDYTIMNRKNLLYTGLTRAKHELFLIGEQNAFTQGLARDADAVRNTTLSQRLRGEKVPALQIDDFSFGDLSF